MSTMAGTVTGNIRKSTITPSPMAGAKKGMVGAGLTASPKIMSNFDMMAGHATQGPNIQKLRK